MWNEQDTLVQFVKCVKPNRKWFNDPEGNSEADGLMAAPVNIGGSLVQTPEHLLMLHELWPEGPALILHKPP